MSEEYSGLDEFDSFVLKHIGTPRHSGRYPWGSGENPYQRNKSFLAEVEDLKRKGMTEAEIAKAFGFKSSTELRALKTIAKTQNRENDIQQALKLKEKGLSNVAIGERMGINESSVRSLLNPNLRERNKIATETADFIKDHVDKAGFIDIGTGTEHHLGISDTKLKVSIKMLEEQGYKVFYYKTEQLGTGKETNIKVLAAPDKTFGDLTKDPSQIRSLAGFSEDGGRSFIRVEPPESLNSKRVAIRYGDEGGADKDGVIELRRGVDDISLGGAKYAQVRIAVDGTHYLKGMAVYSDDMPDGVDVIFNTNKKSTGNKLDAMKKLARDPDNPEFIDQDFPFGSVVRQRHYTDKNGNEKLSPINIVGDNEEGRWHEWNRTLSSQMLSKQSPGLAKQQLDLTYRIKKDELDEINSLTNPAVKKKLLEEFADGADASAVHLKAAGLPRTRTQVILPVNSLKDNEIYAPNYRNGEKVVLIRHPHGGIFEIPELTVNNKNREANSVIKQAKDAVGINSKVAARLSGADFDGDTVLVIPNNNKSIKTSPPLEGLKNFDPQQYKMDQPNGMTGKMKQRQMGEVSNLITDMTIKKASHAEIARAVRHSMVVIDAEKHNLNYKQSAKDNNIAELKQKYQGRANAGAATLISRAKSEERVGARKPRSVKDGGPINPKTGEKMWEYTNETYTKTSVNKRTGAVTTKVLPKTSKSTKMAEAKDAHSLSSGTPMEAVYADHANRLKALANQARKEAYATKPRPVSNRAREVYKSEVNALRIKLKTAQSNAPLERQAQLVAKTIVRAKTQANPNLEASQLKKIRAMALEEARARVGAKKTPVVFTPREWEAIQAGAISNHVLTELLRNANADQVKQLATPRERPVMTDAKINRAKSMLARGYTQAEIAEMLGVPASTLNDAI